MDECIHVFDLMHTHTVYEWFRLGHFICKEQTGAHNIQIYLFIAQGYCSKQGYGTLN